MTILHFVTAFSPLTEPFIYDYIVALEKQGVDNHIVTYYRENEVERPFHIVHVLKNRKNLVGLFIKILFFFSKSPRGYLVNYRRGLKRVIREIKPDIIHAQFGPNGVIINKISKKLKIPLCVTFHGYDISKLIKDEFWLKEYQKLFENGQKFIGVSSHICKKLNKIGCPDEKIKKFSAGIKIEKFRFRESPSIQKNQFNLIFIGRLVEKKSPVLLIKAFKHVCEYFGKNKTLNLSIIGDGPLKKKIISLIISLDLEEQTQILGAISHKEIKDFLYKSHIYVQHSITTNDGDQEGLGMTFLEASATGLPIVATRHNGIPDAVIDGKTGFLVEEGDYIGMAEKIIYLIEHEDIMKKFGSEGRKYVEKNYNTHTQTIKAIDDYKSLIK